jgi:hypothetical protein
MRSLAAFVLGLISGVTPPLFFFAQADRM